MDAFNDWAAPVYNAIANARPRSPTTIRGICPQCDGNSLEATDKGDRILLKCWKGCDNAAIVRGMGLTFRDLYAPSIRKDSNPEQRREENNRRIYEACASAFELEHLIVEIYAHDKRHGREIRQHDHDRHQLALARLRRALGLWPWRAESARFKFNPGTDSPIGVFWRETLEEAESGRGWKRPLRNAVRAQIEAAAVWTMRRDPFTQFRREFYEPL